MSNLFQHNYTILNNSIFLTAIAAVIPVFFLFWALTIKKMAGWKAGCVGLLVIIIDAVLLYKMPFLTAISAAVLGITNGLMPIGWLIVTAVFLFNIIVESGKFEVIKDSISRISPDRRIQVILIAYCFSHFLEGVSGMGAPAAISAAMLIGLGFDPMLAAGICLICNIPPVPYGSVGVPIISTAKVSEISVYALSQEVGKEMFLISIIIPIFILVIMVGWKKTIEVLPVAMVAGIVFGSVYLVISNSPFIELTTILAALASLVALIGFLKLWHPRTIFRFNEELQNEDSPNLYSSKDALIAWLPFIVIMVLMYIWSSTYFKELINIHQLYIDIEKWPLLHGIVYRSSPIVTHPEIYPASYRFEYIGTVGNAILLSAIVSIILFRIKIIDALRVFIQTIKQLKVSLITMSSVIGFAYVANYSGMSYTYGLALAQTGSLFIGFSPLIGAMGTFLTGSVTSSGILFGKLQVVTAEQIGLNPVMTVSSNILGACIGKLISPQSIVIVAASTGLVGQESEILRLAYKYFLFLIFISIGIVLLFAYS